MVDLAVPATDLSGCARTCAAPTPYCTPESACAACLQDSHCPMGQICKTHGVQRLCVPGCSDDARCGGGARCCNGACTDVSKDSGHCGACGTACMTANGTASCVNGTCVAGTCAAGWGDCNMSGPMGDGCETNLRTDPKNCTACGMTCSFKNATAACADGCYITACSFGWDDCDAMDQNGCETAVISDPKNCGACGMACPGVPHAKNGCINGSCQLTGCDVGWSDCNGNLQDGCEVGTGTDVRNCGLCGNACPQGAVCVGGACTCPQCNIPNARPACVNFKCAIDSCLPNFGDCDGLPQNGCERPLGNDASNCGACGKVCPQGLICNLGACTCPQCNIPNAKTACVNNVCVLDSCLPGWSNCDNFAGNGCESDVSSDAKNCGGCNVVCPQNAPFCTGGNCNNVLKSCLDIFNAGGRQNGNFTIDPDGAGPLPQAQVYCDMASGGHTLYAVQHNWGEWGANMTIVVRDRLAPAVGQLNDWTATCQIFGKTNYAGGWKNHGGTYSAQGTLVYADSKDWWENFALKVMPDMTFDKFVILQDALSTGCWAWYAEAGSLQSFGSPVGAGFAFCRGGNATQQRYHIYLCI